MDQFGRFTWGVENDFRKDPRKPKVRHKCPVCHRVQYLIPWAAKNKKFCSHKCAVTTYPAGEYASGWKGGKAIRGGYMTVYVGRGKYELEHRLVMEMFLGRALAENEIVHHSNGNKLDNRLENLEIMLRATHNGEVRCPHCLKAFKIK
ncbi:MAG: HNH endonuclease signature motif containing protein [Patescibacteria group bacterium]